MVNPPSKNLLKIPPFRDSHMHFMEEGHPLERDEVARLAGEFLSRGILAIDDMGHKTGRGLGFKQKLPRPQTGPLQIRTAGQALYKKGSYGGFLGKGISGAMEIKKAIREIAESGADFIKIINSGIVSLRNSALVTPGGFNGEEWEVIREEAGRVNLMIRCHANGDRAVQQALAYGAASIEHGFFISNETLHWMADRQAAWVPTGVALLNLKCFRPKDEQFLIEKIIENHLKAVYDSMAFGVNLRIGTDSGSKGVAPGLSFFEELQLFKRAGLSREQLLTAACLGGEEMEKGNYLLVEENFVEEKKIFALFVGGHEMKQDVESRQNNIMDKMGLM